jgi:hypothetical protein
MAQNDQPIAERDKNCNSEECGGCAPVSAPEEPQDDETRKDVANSLDPHKGKGGGIVDWDSEAGRGSNWIEYKVDADSDDRDGYHKSAPEQQRIPFQNNAICVRVHVHVHFHFLRPFRNVTSAAGKWVISGGLLITGPRCNNAIRNNIA